MSNSLCRIRNAISDCLVKAIEAFDNNQIEEFEVNIQRALTSYDTLKRVKSLIKALDAVEEAEKCSQLSE